METLLSSHIWNVNGFSTLVSDNYSWLYPGIVILGFKVFLLWSLSSLSAGWSGSSWPTWPSWRTSGSGRQNHNIPTWTTGTHSLLSKLSINCVFVCFSCINKSQLWNVCFYLLHLILCLFAFFILKGWNRISWWQRRKSEWLYDIIIVHTGCYLVGQLFETPRVLYRAFASRIFLVSKVKLDHLDNE